jgi:hypothetical protein
MLHWESRLKIFFNTNWMQVCMCVFVYCSSSSQMSTLTVSVNLCRYSAMKDNTNCPQVKECAKFCLDAASGGGDQSMRQKIDDIVKPKIKQGENILKSCTITLLNE